MPKPPTHIDRINGIVDFWMDPCEAPFTVYAQTALPPLGRFVLELMTFGLGDIVRGFLRPKGLRSARHGRRGKRGGKGGGIPEVGNMIGARLYQTSGQPNTLSYGKGEYAFWVADGNFQRALYWVMIIDLVTDFLYGWASLLTQSGYCTKPNQVQAQTRRNSVILGDTFGNWSTWGVLDTTKANLLNVNPLGSAVGNLQGITTTALVATTVTNIDPLFRDVTVTAAIGVDGLTDVRGIQTETLSFGESTQLLTSVTFTNANIVLALYKGEGGFITAVGTYFQVMRRVGYAQ